MDIVLVCVLVLSGVIVLLRLAARRRAQGLADLLSTGDAPTWPVFLLDGGDVVPYASVAELTKDVEAWMGTQPVAWLDGEGRPVRLLTRGRITVGVELSGEPPMPERLRRALARYLAAMGAPAPEDADLPAYAQAAASIIERSGR